MADFKLTVDDSEVERSMENLAKMIEKNQSEFDQLSESGTAAFKEISQATGKSEAEVKQYNKQLEDTATASKKAEQESSRLSRGISSFLRSINIGGKNIGEMVDGLKNLKSSSQSAGGSLEGAGGSAGRFSKVIGVAKLGLLAIAAVIIGTVVAALAKFQSNLDKGRIIGAQFKAGLDVSLKAIGTWGNALIKTVTGQQKFSEAMSEAREETKNFNKELKEQIKLEGQLEQQLINLERQQKVQAASKELQRQEIERLNLIADDESKTFKTRLAAAQKRQSLASETGKLEEKNALKSIALNSRIAGSEEDQLKRARQIVEGVRNQSLTFEELAKQIAKTGISEVEAFKKTEDVLKNIESLADVQEQLFTLQSESQNQATQIRNEAKQAAEARRKEIEEASKAIQELLNTTAAARVQLGDENDAIQSAYSDATAEVQRLKNEYLRLSQILRTGETAEDIERLFKPLQDIADIDFEKASFGQSLEVVTTGLDRLLKATTDPLTGNIADLVSSQTATPLKDRLRADGLEAGKALGAAIVQGQQLEAARQQEKGNELARQLVGQLAPEAINAFFEAEQARFELQIAQQDALIAKNQERLDKEKQVLEEQQKLADDGLANDVKGAQKRVQEQERLLREGEARKIEIERKAAKQRAIIAAGQQAVELTLSVAKLISAEASKGLIGLVLALGGIAIISRLMASARSQAASEAGKTAAFARGTEYVEGAGTETSDSIPARLSRGERVLTAKDNRKLGGRKLANEDLVHYAMIGQRFAETPLLDYALSLKGRTEQYEALKLELQFDVMRNAYRDAALEAADKQIGYWKSRPIEYQNAAGEMVREWYDGNGVVRQVTVKGE